MYHRYQPSENGQFRRQTVPDVPRKSTSPSHVPHPPEQRPTASIQREQPSSRREHGQTPPPAIHTQPRKVPLQDPSTLPPPHFQLPFLEKLLPNMDNGDLLLLLIMLLLISEGNEESSSVVMTLAIFLFLQ